MFYTSQYHVTPIEAHSQSEVILRSVCYYFQYWREILPCFDFYVVIRSYSSRLFLCALDFGVGEKKWTSCGGGLEPAIFSLLRCCSSF